MLLFVFFIATLNLAVGYALGAGLTPASLLDFLPKRSARPEAIDLDEEEPLSRAPAPSTGTVEMAVEPSKPAAPDIMASLSDFRSKLSTASADLKQNEDDPDKFDESATKLQQASHAYLEEAEGAIQQLDALGADGDEKAAATRDVVATGTAEVAALSNEIDGLIEEGLDDASRKQLTSKSGEISATASRLEASAAESRGGDSAEPAPAAAAPPPAQGNPPRVVESVDDLFARLAGLLSDGEEKTKTLPIAAVQIDAPAGAEQDEKTLAKLEQGVAQLAAETLGESQTYFVGKPTMALLEGDTFEAAIERLELLRQQVESATFSVDGQQLKATVTCAMAEAHVGDGRQALLEQLEQALAESTRNGPNHTFHHDGAFPTAVPGLDLKTDAKTVEVG